MRSPRIPCTLRNHVVLLRRAFWIPMTQLESAERGVKVRIPSCLQVVSGTTLRKQKGAMRLREGSYLRILLKEKVVAPPQNSQHISSLRRCYDLV